MTLTEAMERLPLTDLTGNASSEREVSGVYTGDLLSHVMGKAPAGSLWLTVQTNVNIVAVAVLCDVAAIVIPEGIAVDNAVLEKARAQEVVILSTEQTTYDFIVAFSKLL